MGSAADEPPHKSVQYAQFHDLRIGNGQLLARLRSIKTVDIH